MQNATRVFFKPSTLTLASVMLIALGMLVWGYKVQGSPAPIHLGGIQITGVPDDWTHHHVVFSNPGTEGEASRHGKYHDEWLKTVNDPRYIFQQLKRHVPAEGPAAQAVAAREEMARAAKATGVEEAGTGGIASALSALAQKAKPTKAKMSKDWSEALKTGAVLPNAYPAKYGTSPTGAATCSDYVVYPTGSTGSSTAATIIAYTNLYVGSGACEASNPTVYWAYNTGAAVVTTSPVLSLDGSKVAFIQTTSGSAKLVVLKWASSGHTVSTPVTPATSTNITTCSAPCMTVTTISGTIGDNYSSPYYDYDNDALYVGDNASHLYKLTGVFNGTSSPGVTSVTLNATAYNVASPVYDSTSGCIFVGDSEGFLYSVSSGVAGTVCTGSTFALFGHSANLAAGAANEGIFDAPLVDETAETVYVFIADSGAFSSCAKGDNCVAQFTASRITSGSTTATPNGGEPLGAGAAGILLFDGAFDNVYYSSANPGSPSGSIYVVGNLNTPNNGNQPAANLYQVTIASNVMTAVATELTGFTKGQPAWPSPLTEFCNNGANACAVTGGATTSGTDYIFFSVYRGNVGNCSSGDLGEAVGCLYAFAVNSPSSVSVSSSTSVELTWSGGPGNVGCEGTGAFIIDNSSTSTGASQIYFVNLNGNVPAAHSSACGTGSTNTIQAVQASQSNVAN